MGCEAIRININDKIENISILRSKLPTKLGNIKYSNSLKRDKFQKLLINKVWVLLIHLHKKNI